MTKKKFYAFLMITLGVFMGVSMTSCGSDDDNNDPKSAADIVAGTYDGDFTQNITMMNFTDKTKNTFIVKKVGNENVDIMVPSFTINVEQGNVKIDLKFDAFTIKNMPCFSTSESIAYIGTKSGKTADGWENNVEDVDFKADASINMNGVQKNIEIVGKLKACKSGDSFELKMNYNPGNMPYNVESTFSK